MLMSSVSSDDEGVAGAAATLRIHQQNLNKSRAAQLDFINTLNPDGVDVVALQEPWKYPDNHRSFCEPSLRVVYPTTHYESDSLAAATRSIMFVNVAVSTNSWAPLAVDSPDVTAIEMRTDARCVCIFNIYNDCNNDNALDALRRAVERVKAEKENDERELVLVWVGDFNRHHTAWEEPRNYGLCGGANREAAERLLDLTEDFEMEMALPARIPTLIACSTKNLTRVDNVFISENAISDVTFCNALPEDRPVKTDHFPVRTVIECPVIKADIEPRRNFRSVEWKEFVTTLRETLEREGGLGERVADVETLKSLYNRVMTAINTAINEHVPFVKPSPFQKMWWAKELKVMAEKRKKMQRKAYRWEKRGRYHPCIDEYRAYRGEYERAFEAAKSGTLGGFSGGDRSLHDVHGKSYRDASTN